VSIIATDLDGTLFKGQTLIDGVREGLIEIINEGIEIYYTTNNSSQTPSEIKNKLEDVTTFIQINPGPLQYADESFDMVFSKEAFLHIPDKEALLKDIHRILKPGGLIVVSDWMRKDDNPPSKQMQEYIDAEGLDMLMCSLKRYKELLEATNFTDIKIKDRNDWYLEKAKKELEEIEGPLYQKVLDVLGLEETLGAIDIWKKLIGVLEIGEHRPGHFKAKKIK